MRKTRTWPWKKAWGKEISRPEEGERLDLEAGLLQTQKDLHHAYAGFNAAGDPEMVESFVYEIRALQSRYSYLLRRRKALERPQVSTFSAL